jgi:hypothetical protein
MNSEDIGFYLLLLVPYLLLFALVCVLIPKIRRAIARRIEALGNQIIEPEHLPTGIKENISLLHQETILLAVRFPLKVSQIHGRKIISNLMLISTEQVHFLLYLKGRGIQESTRLLFSNIDSIEVKTKEIGGLFKRPFITISSFDNSPVTILFPSNKIGTQNIERVLESFRKANSELRIIGEVPNDFRSEKIKKRQESTKDLRDKIDYDLNDLFK